ncbi:UNVERIFIED_CONTAM: hypothetical protein Slati_2448500 [Sesamum latifolium]|uniref:Reverse transcriptase n=1 Tax=Sesamum latifolium TaxID=2727402 RepID=A0AAW2WEB6_9LAMI
MRQFLWKGSSGRGYAKVSWQQVCASKKEGGLGIRRVLHLNQALMLKQVRHILQEDEQSIWVQWVLIHRLRIQTMWVYQCSTATWCCKKLIKLSTLLILGLEYRIGDGRKFKLWTDLWHPRGPLIHSFPRGPTITGLPADSLLMTGCIKDSGTGHRQRILTSRKLFRGCRTYFLNNLIQLFGGCIRRYVRFQWLGLGWQRDILWACKKWRGGHLLNAATRAMLASMVYNIWREHNNRCSSDTAASAESVAIKAIEEIRCRIISAEIRPSLQLFILYRIWKIP